MTRLREQCTPLACEATESELAYETFHPHPSTGLSLHALACNSTLPCESAAGRRVRQSRIKTFDLLILPAD